MTLDRVLKTLSIVLGSTTVASAASHWPVAVTILGVVTTALTAWMAQAPIDHAAIAARKEAAPDTTPGNAP